MKQSLAMLLSITFIASIAQAEPLRIFTWEDYINPEIVAKFEAQSGEKVEFVYFENDEVRDQIMVETPGYGFDLLLVDDQKMPSYIEQGWITPVNLPELDSHDTRWKTWFPENVGYGYPYGYGTYGIAYRTDLIKSPPRHWRDLFDPTTEYASQVQMPGQLIEILMVAALVDGDPNDLYESSNIARARELLSQQSDRGAIYRTSSIDEDNLLINGDVLVAVNYSTDVLSLQDLSDNIGFVVPEEKNVIWVDYFAISQESNNKELALNFLKFLAQPDINAENINHIYMASFNIDALSMVDEEILENEIVFPDISGPVYTLQDPTRTALRAMMHLQNELDLNLE
jgi:spermidine/putrescine transport system substrate-binding protein